MQLIYYFRTFRSDERKIKFLVHHLLQLRPRLFLTILPQVILTLCDFFTDRFRSLI
jgi:hypothetical protein